MDDRVDDKVRPFRKRRPSPGNAASDGVGGAAGASGDTEPDDCPVVCLGHCQGVYFYLTKMGEMRALAFKDHSRNGLTSLFDGDLAWAYAKAASDTGGWSPAALAAKLMRRSAEAGVFDPATPVRGVGVWPPSAPTSAPIVHCGDALSVDGGPWEPPGRLLRDAAGQAAVYAAAPRISRPDTARPAGAEVGGKIAEAVALWNFRDPGAADLWLGFVGSALLGGAPPWRAHLFVLGRFGSGKSTLAAFAQALLGAQATAVNDYTEAGLRQALTHQSRAVILDEAELRDDGSGPIALVIELLRRMSGGAGAVTVKGSAGGTAKHFHLAAPAYLSAVLGVDLKPQDRSRIAEIELRPLAEGARADKVDAAISWAAKHSPGLRARAILAWPRFRDLVEIYRAAIVAAGGERRLGDQFGTLLAGRDLLLHDTLPDADGVDEVVLRVMPLIVRARETARDDDEAALCLNHLLTAPVDSWSGGDRKVLSLLVNDERFGAGDSKRIEAYGLRLDKRGPGKPALLVAHRHNSLERIFHGTRWARGRWATALARLDGAEAHPVPVRFNGVQSRAVRIPVEHLPMEELPTLADAESGDNDVSGVQ